MGKVQGDRQGGHQDHKLWQKLIAETLGTFLLTFASAGTAVLVATPLSETTQLSHALAPGFVDTALIYAIGNVSGAHFNPTVTFAFFLRRVFPLRLVWPYLVMQLFGALLGGIATLLLLGNAQDGATVPKASAAAAFGMELLLCCLLVVVILGTATRHRSVGANAAVPVGCMMSLCGLLGTTVSGPSMNPARSLGLAFVSGRHQALWIYLTAPFAGAALAVMLTAALHRHQHPEETEAAEGD